MQPARDLARAEPWRESLERSRARRQRSPRTPALGTRVGGIAALALLPAVLVAIIGDRAHRGTAVTARAQIVTASVPFRPARATGATPAFRPAAGRRRRTCPMVVASSGYVNPLAGARVMPERIDMGVDYAGSGPLLAIGAGRVKYVGTSGTGWPGAFIEYRLLGGPDAGCYVYYAEGVIPASTLRAGETVAAGEEIANVIPYYPTGIELGWAAGTGTNTFAAAAGQWNAGDDQGNTATPAGKNFSALIAALGGPPGKVEG